MENYKDSFELDYNDNPNETQPNKIKNKLFINVQEFKLPNHVNELSKAENKLKTIKDEINLLTNNNQITNLIHTQYYENIIRILDYVGYLSTPAFIIEDKLNEMYTLQYPHTPELAKKLWLDHYESIHQPYNILKNRCFKLLEELDEIYLKKFKTYPPNWN